MNVFELRNRLIEDYSSFVKGFINIRDKKIKHKVAAELDSGALWPEALLQLNPFFTLGESINELIDQKILHPDCDKIFRIKANENDLGKAMQLYHHQSAAIRQAHENQNYVLTTGTGSGKSLAYIIPIVNHILKTGSGKGVKAIIIYPMNALANSQEKELEKFLKKGFSPGPVSFKRYTGQESDEQKRVICANPPDIILTNYVMLELILTRPDEEPLVKACRNLKFLVLDELHTYRGRQGADVAMLVRRTKDATQAKDLICVGTSATMSTGDDSKKQKEEISRIASLLFGSPVQPQNIISEDLQRVTTSYDFELAKNLELLQKAISSASQNPKLSFEQFQKNHLASWIESSFGLREDPSSGELIRCVPQSLSGEDGGAKKLSELSKIDLDTCTKAIQNTLMQGYQIPNPANWLPSFTFRLHQFISRGDMVYSSLDEAKDRYLTLQKQLFVPGSKKSKALLPLVFCRHCGQEYFSVFQGTDEKSGIVKYRPRDLGNLFSPDEEENPGFLYDGGGVSQDEIVESFPAEWKDRSGKILKNRRDYLPKALNIGLDGLESDKGRAFYYMQAPFRYCLQCGVSHAPSQRSDFAKLSALGTEGRSTATTVLSLSSVRHLRKMELEDKAKKLLSFTDNRQDASLQAGHFNDFVMVGALRGGLYKALQLKGEEGIHHEKLTQLVFESLALPLEEYSSNPSVTDPGRINKINKALREVLGYHLFLDLRRGWRVTAPNLEQTGLLEIQYPELKNLANDQGQWASSHPALEKADPQTRENVLKILLDWMRRNLAIKVSYLDVKHQEQIEKQSYQRLIPPWGFDDTDEHRKLSSATLLYPRPRNPNKKESDAVFLSNRSGFGQYLRRSNTFKKHPEDISLEETQIIIQNLLTGLEAYGIIENLKKKDDKDPAYQLLADAILWKKGNERTGYHDPIRQSSESDEEQPINTFFRDFYKTVALSTLGLQAREHTAQVSYDERQNREEDFRKGTLPILYCSPTMELGIDISQLNVVNMRNIPPTPANYAQRSGRAGRSGQPALIFSYCSTGSPHDQYFFKRPQNMVSGVVATPQIDIANEDMLRSHIHAIWLSEAGLKLGVSLVEVLDTSGLEPSLEIFSQIENALSDSGIISRAHDRARRIVATIRADLKNSAWYTPDWLTDVFKELPQQFNQACDRWRELYKAALHQQRLQNNIVMDSSQTLSVKKQARRLRAEAESQLNMLTSAQGAVQSDFYSYRYFASEGFLPGYNFPRLPLSAFIPGKISGNDDYLSRPRFLAITEFGPRSFVYHEGSRYVISQVIMPAQENLEGVSTSEAKLCPACGYLHPGKLSDVCENCQSELGAAIPNLFRLQNVVAKRRDQINCDEEERLRLGFDVRSTLRFATKQGNPACIKAELFHGESLLAKLTYGDAAELWRINMGYRKRREGEPQGFWLDSEQGYWARRPDEDESDSPFQQNKNTILVCPYVSDTKNCLLFEPCFGVDSGIMASLQSALKNAIQQVFELEDSELAAEALPSRDERKSILFYEATEGGAGVLKQVLDAEKFREIIIKAIEHCHFDSQSFKDLKRAKNSKEDCEAACYDCLLSYTNQMDHELLDRKSIIQTLRKLLESRLSRSAGFISRQQQYEELKRLTGSDLERRWLENIYQNGYILPNSAQELLEGHQARSDFMYSSRVVIFIDGHVHDDPIQKEKDKKLMQDIEDTGRYHAIRFRYNDDWQAIIDRHPGIFGKGNLHE